MKNKILIVFIVSSIYNSFCLASFKTPAQKKDQVTGHGNAMFYPVFKTPSTLLKETQYSYNHNILLKASSMKQVSDSEIKKVKNILKILDSK